MNTTSPLLETVVSWFDNAKPNGTGVLVRCPAHEDRKQSLHLSEGRDGRVVMKCHAGCETADVLTRVGKTFSDLFPPKEQRKPPSAAPILSAYSYEDENGTPRFQSVRKQFPDGSKTFYQRQPKPGGGWINNLQGVQRLPYRLPELLATPKDEYVLLPEGEKDVERAMAAGFTATTNAGGAGKFTEAEAVYLAGRPVVLIPDHDQPGYQHALKAARLLDGATTSVTIVQLTDVLPKGDLSDFLDTNPSLDDLDALFTGRVSEIPGAKLIDLDELATLADEASAKSAYVHCADEGEVESGPSEFPLDVFPEAVRRYVADGADAINVPPDMIALPLLGFAAGVMGNTRAVLVKSGWVERPNFWAAVIGDPGSGKSPALDYARQPLDDLQREAWDRYQLDLAEWEESVASAKAAKGNTDPLPERPVLEHFFTTDATTEAIASILSTTPGVVVVRDELVGWVKSHDAYRKAGDRQSYLSLWAGAPLKVDRKGAPTLYVSHPCVPIVGAIQPDMLSDLGEEAKRRDGFVERILMVWPTPRPIRWSETTVDPNAARAVASIFAQLRLRGGSSAVIGFDPEARRTFGRWYEENGRIIEESRGVAAGCYAKYPGQLARLALILHALRFPGDVHRNIDVQTLSDAITVIEYFRAHLVRILPTFEAIGSTKSAGLSTRILRVLSKAGGEWVARRELRAGLGNSVPSDEIATVLDLLEGEGLVENRTVPTGSRPRQESRALTSHNAHMHKPPAHEEVVV